MYVLHCSKIINFARISTNLLAVSKGNNDNSAASLAAFRVAPLEGVTVTTGDSVERGPVQ
jgi:hypothetical protein